MKKFWTVRDGQVGTAHTSRDGREVDFRPATDRPTLKEEVGGRKVFEIRPPKGVAAEPLILELTHEEWVVTKKDHPNPGMEVGNSIYRSNFCGVEFEVVTTGQWRWYDEQKRAEQSAAQKAARADWKREEQKKAMKQEEFVAPLRPEWFLGKLTLRELTQLRQGSLDLARRLKQEICRAVREDLGHEKVLIERTISWFFLLEDGEKKLAEIRELLLAEEGRLREEKKRKWLEKSGQGGEQ